MDSEEAQAIKRDREKHPNCNYSTAVQETCKNVDGDVTCEILRRVMRHCPNKRPVEIFSRSEQEQNPEGGMRLPGMFGGGKDEDMFGFPNDMLKGFGLDPFGMLEEMFRGFPGAEPPSPPMHRTPPPSIPPHRRGQNGDLQGKPTGPVERV